MLCEAGIVFGVDDGEFAAGEWDFAEVIAEAEVSEEEKRQN